MALWYDEEFQGTRLGLVTKKTLFSGQSDFQKVEVFETDAYGRVLAIDSVFMTSERDEFFYHEMLNHPALLTHPNPERVLVIGGGDGGSVREILRHPSVKTCVMIEIDEMVVRASQEHLPTIGTAWDDPRLDLRFADGIDYVKNSDEPKYDIVILDGTDPIGPGEVLFAMEFFRGCKRMLRPDGILAMQSETPVLMSEVFFETQGKLRELWKNVHPYFGPVPLYASGIWSWTWCSDMHDVRAIDAARYEPLREGCRYYNPEVHLASLALPNYVRRGLAKLKNQ